MAATDKDTSLLLVFGGESSESEISIWSARFIHSLLRSKYAKLSLGFLSKSGAWFGYFHDFPKEPEREGKQTSISNLLEGVTCVVNGFHGGQGENGTFQGFLDMLGVKYTGSGVLASALAMDKAKSNSLFEMVGLTVAPFVDISKTDKYPENLLGQLSFPIFLKPTTGGSSFLASPANNLTEALNFLKTAFLSENRMLAQERIQGIEVSIGVLEKRNEDGGIETFPLLPTEIRHKSDFFDTNAKYTKGESEEITPAPLPKELTKLLQNQSLLAHKTLGCQGYSRTDFIIKEGVPYVLETNTLPGMTETSLIPQQVKALGLDMSQVFEWLIDLA